MKVCNLVHVGLSTTPKTGREAVFPCGASLFPLHGFVRIIACVHQA